MFEDKRKIDFIRIEEKLVDESKLIFDYIITNSKKSYCKSLSKFHPNISVLMLPLGVGLLRDWIDFYNKDLRESCNLFFNSSSPQDIIIKVDKRSCSSVTKVVSSNYDESFVVNWDDDLGEFISQVLTISYEDKLFVNQQRVYKNDKNLSAELREVYEDFLKVDKRSPDEIYHKVFSGFGDYLKKLTNLVVLSEEELKSFSGEMIELAYKSSSLNENLPDKFVKFGFTKTLSRVVFFEIIEGESAEFKEVVFNSEKFIVRSKFDKLINLYE